MKKRIFITGATGFVGSHLLEHLADKANYEVYGTSFGETKEAGKWIDPERLFQVNLLEKDKVEALVDRVRPNYVVHLAALTSPKASFDDPGETLNNNISAQLHLLNALRPIKDEVEKILVIGSAEEYGSVSQKDCPIDEQVELKPTNPYAVSKIAQDYLGLQYFISDQLPIVRLRPFNHTGERQPPMFVIPAFARQVAEIESGRQEPVMRVGNLEAIRDFADVKDVVRAYELALVKARAGEVYNIGSGRGIRVREVLEILLSLSQADIEVMQDPERMKPADVPVLIANKSKFAQETGWQPQIPIRETIERVLDYWRGKVTSNNIQ